MANKKQKQKKTLRVSKLLVDWLLSDFARGNFYLRDLQPLFLLPALLESSHPFLSLTNFQESKSTDLDHIGR